MSCFFCNLHPTKFLEVPDLLTVVALLRFSRAGFFNMVVTTTRPVGFVWFAFVQCLSLVLFITFMWYFSWTMGSSVSASSIGPMKSKDSLFPFIILAFKINLKLQRHNSSLICQACTSNDKLNNRVGCNCFLRNTRTRWPLQHRLYCATLKTNTSCFKVV